MDWAHRVTWGKVIYEPDNFFDLKPFIVGAFPRKYGAKISMKDGLTSLLEFTGEVVVDRRAVDQFTRAQIQGPSVCRSYVNDIPGPYIGFTPKTEKIFGGDEADDIPNLLELDKNAATPEFLETDKLEALPELLALDDESRANNWYHHDTCILELSKLSEYRATFKVFRVRRYSLEREINLTGDSTDEGNVVNNMLTFIRGQLRVNAPTGELIKLSDIPTSSAAQIDRQRMGFYILDTRLKSVVSQMQRFTGGIWAIGQYGDINYNRRDRFPPAVLANLKEDCYVTKLTTENASSVINQIRAGAREFNKRNISSYSWAGTDALTRSTYPDQILFSASWSLPARTGVGAFSSHSFTQVFTYTGVADYIAITTGFSPSTAFDTPNAPWPRDSSGTGERVSTPYPVLRAPQFTASGGNVEFTGWKFDDWFSDNTLGFKQIRATFNFRKQAGISTRAGVAFACFPGRFGRTTREVLIPSEAQIATDTDIQESDLSLFAPPTYFHNSTLMTDAQALLDSMKKRPIIVSAHVKLVSPFDYDPRVSKAIGLQPLMCVHITDAETKLDHDCLILDVHIVNEGARKHRKELMLLTFDP